MKKELSLIIAFFMLLGIFIFPAGAEETTLKVWCIQSSATTDYATNTQSAWMKEQTGIEVNYVDVPQSGWVDSFRNYVLSGETADIYLYDFDTNEISALSEMGAVLPLEDLIREYAPNISALFEKNAGIVNALTAPDGHIYSLFGRTYNQLEFTQKVYVNRDWLATYEQATGKGIPETTEEFRNMLIYFRDNDMNGNGKADDEIPMLGANGIDAVYYFLGSYIPANSAEAFGCTSNNEGKLVFQYNTEEFKNALQFIKELYDDGLYSADSFTLDVNNRYSYTSGSRTDVRAGVVSGATLSAVVQLSGEEDSMNYDSYIAIPPVAGPNGVRTIVSRGAETIVMRGAISATCADPVTAIKWLDYCFSEEARKFSVYGGLEGIDWQLEDGKTLEGDGQVVAIIGGFKDNHCWQGDHCISYQLIEDDFTKMDARDISRNSALATYRANLAYRPYAVTREWPPIVWAGDQKEIAYEYSELNTAIQQTMTNYYTQVILGTKNLEGDWDAYTAELETIGVTRFVELCELYISQQ